MEAKKDAEKDAKLEAEKEAEKNAKMEAKKNVELKASDARQTARELQELHQQAVDQGLADKEFDRVTAVLMQTTENIIMGARHAQDMARDLNVDDPKFVDKISLFNHLAVEARIDANTTGPELQMAIDNAEERKQAREERQARKKARVGEAKNNA